MTGPGREPTVSDEEILHVFEETSDPVLTTKEVATAINLGRRGTLQRLEQLTEDGHLQNKKVGKGNVWWSPTALKNHYTSNQP